MLEKVSADIKERQKEYVEFALGVLEAVENKRRAVPSEVTGANKDSILHCAIYLACATMIAQALDRQTESSNQSTSEFTRLVQARLNNENIQGGDVRVPHA